MPSCSVHHCVLFLLTITLTTDPGAAAVFPIYVKLHQPGILPCEAQCSGRAKWSLDSKRDDVFAWCNQTSCTSVQQGFNMSHDQYKRGDLSLIITNPDYSMRETYTCECERIDYVTVRLKISTVFSAVHVQTEGDLKLDLSVPESVEVIYRRSDSADGVQICTVTNRTLQCNTEYTPRTSLSNSELTLRVWRGESGTYTIRNLDYKEDIRVYAVSVSGLTSGETAGIVIVLLLLLAGLIAGVMYYRKKIAAAIEVKRLKEEVKKLIKAGLVKNTPGLLTEANLIGINSDLKKVKEKGEEVKMVRAEAVKEIIDLEETYRGDSEYSQYIRCFCNEQREELGLSTYSTVEKPTLSPESETEQFNLEKLENVNRAVEKVVELLKKARRAINDLEEKYSEDETNKRYITWFCNNKRRELGSWKDPTADSVPAWVKSDMEAVNDLMDQAVIKPGGVVMEALQQVEEEINDLEQKFSGDSVYSEHVTSFCKRKRDELKEYRNMFELGDVQRGEFILELGKVTKAVEKALKKARRAINDLEEKYRGDETNKRYVTWFCNNKRTELGLWKDLTADSVPAWSLEVTMEMAVRILEELRHEASAEKRVIPSSELYKMFSCAKECLENVNSCCRQGRSDMKVDTPQIKQWTEEKMVDWNKYKVELLGTPETQRNADRVELEPLV